MIRLKPTFTDLYLLYDRRVVKRHRQGVAMSVVKVNLCDCVAAGICEGHRK